MNGFMVLDDMEETPGYYDEDSSSQTMDVASELGVNQTAGPAGENSGQPTNPGQKSGEERARKIKPVKHPGLKLQTPIAYQRDTDPSVIPIKKDGMG